MRPRTSGSLSALIGAIVLITIIAGGASLYIAHHTAQSDGSTTSMMAASVPACVTTDLTLSLGSVSSPGAARLIDDVVLKNTSTSTCSLNGYPKVVLADDNGNTAGQAAVVTSATPKTVSLLSGQSAQAVITLPTSAPAQGDVCASNTAVIKVYPPDQTQPLTEPFTQPWCPGFTVGPITALK